MRLFVPTTLSLLAGLGLAAHSHAQTTRPATAPSWRPGASFLSNAGQWEPGVLFATRRGGLLARFRRTAVELFLERPGETRGVKLRLAFEDARPDLTVSGEQRRTGRHRFLSKAGRAAEARGYGALLYRGLYPGVDLRLRDGGGLLQYDLLLAAGAEAAAVRVHCEGVERLSLDSDGTLRLHTALGDITQAPPVTWQEGPGGERQPVRCRYVLLGRDRYGFRLADRDATKKLVIDPPLQWSTYFGNTQDERILAVRRDGAGDVLVAGYTTSLTPSTSGGFYPGPSPTPLRCGSYQRAAGGGVRDGFVAKLDPDAATTVQQLVWATYFGGSGDDTVTSMELDAAGAPVIAGYTTSPATTFPLTAGVIGTQGKTDAFVAKLSSDGCQLSYSAIVAGTEDDAVSRNSLHVGPGGDLTFAGTTSSAATPAAGGWPVANAVQSASGGGIDGFVVCLNPSAGLLYSSFLGGSKDDSAIGLAVAGNGDVYVSGYTASSDFPSLNALYTYAGSNDAFVQCQTALTSASTVRFATTIGSNDDDRAYDVAVDGTGGITLIGTTRYGCCPRFPVTSGTAFLGASDGFVLRLRAGGLGLDWSTLIGGTSNEVLTACELDGAGAIMVAGYTDSSSLPVTSGCFQARPAGGRDALFFRLGPQGLVRQYGTFLGGSGDDFAYDLAFDPDRDRVVLAGSTQSGAFPTANAYQSGRLGTGGRPDGFVCELDLLPEDLSLTPPKSVVRRTCPVGCAQASGPVMTSIGLPCQGTDFGLACRRAPSQAAGALLLDLTPAQTCLSFVQGCQLVSLNGSTLVVPVTSSRLGGHQLFPLHYPAGPQLTIYAQYAWYDAGSGTFVTSDGLKL